MQALKSDGTVVAWGYSNFESLPGVDQATNVPPGLSNVVAIAAGTAFALALRSDGTVVAWGFDDRGQTNVPAGLSNVVAIAASHVADFSAALRSDGTVVAWGYNFCDVTNPPPGLQDVVAVSAGGGTLMAVTFELRNIRVEVADEGPRIHFKTWFGHRYLVEYSADPTCGEWLPLSGGEVQGDGQEVCVTDTSGLGVAARFYRVRRSP